MVDQVRGSCAAVLDLSDVIRELVAAIQAMVDGCSVSVDAVRNSDDRCGKLVGGVLDSVAAIENCVGALPDWCGHVRIGGGGVREYEAEMPDLVGGYLNPCVTALECGELLLNLG